MRYRTLLPLFLLVWMSCKSGDSLNPQKPSSCANSGYVRGATFTKQDAMVIKKNVLGTPAFLLEFSDVAGYIAPVTICNLPDQFKKDKIAVRISGYYLTYIPTGQEALLNTPVELTEIEPR